MVIYWNLSQNCIDLLPLINCYFAYSLLLLLWELEIMEAQEIVGNCVT